MGYIVIFKRLVGILNIAVLVLPMVQYNTVADMFWSAVQRDSRQRDESFKPSTDDRGIDAELCVSSPNFQWHRHKFVQTFNFVQKTMALIAQNCRRRRRSFQPSWEKVHWCRVCAMNDTTLHKKNLINTENKNNNCSLFQSSKLIEKNISNSCLESRCIHWMFLFIYLILLHLKT